MTASGPRRGFLRLAGGLIAGAAVVGAAAKSQSAAPAAAPPPEVPELPVDPQAPRVVEFPAGPVTAGTNIPRWVGEGGRLHPGARAGALEVVWQVNPAEKLIAFTFDDGPVPGVSEVLYDVLDETGIKATLFVVGKRVEQFGEMMRGRVDRHEIGNHTYSHTTMFTKTDAEIEEDLTAAHRAVAEVLGKEPRIFRPPYSHVNGGTLVAAAQLGYDVVMWNNNIGYQGYEDQEDRLVRDVVETVFPGSIVLCHDGGPEYLISIRNVPKIVSELKAQGYEFVTISELREASKA